MRKSYINREELLNEFLISINQDKITDKFLALFTLIVERIATRGNFKYYSYLNDMKQYSLELFLNRWKSFKPENYDTPNPFAYYTTMITHAFIYIINRETRHSDNCLSYDTLDSPLENTAILNNYANVNSDYYFQQELDRNDLNSPVTITTFSKCDFNPRKYNYKSNK